MNKKTVLITLGITASLVGLGFLMHHLSGGKRTVAKKKTGSRDSYNTVRKGQKKPCGCSEKKTNQLPKADEFPLRLGSEGPRVERLQVWLMRNYGWTGAISSSFDEKTKHLVKKYLKIDRIDKEIYHELGMGKPVYEQTLTR